MKEATSRAGLAPGSFIGVDYSPVAVSHNLERYGLAPLQQHKPPRSNKKSRSRKAQGVAGAAIDAAAAAAAASAVQQDGLSFLHMDARDMSFPAGSFDVVVDKVRGMNSELAIATIWQCTCCSAVL